jgi:hypothetical protein
MAESLQSPFNVCLHFNRFLPIYLVRAHQKEDAMHVDVNIVIVIATFLFNAGWLSVVALLEYRHLL